MFSVLIKTVLFAYIALKFLTLVWIGDPRLNTYKETIKLDLDGGPITYFNETHSTLYYVLRKQIKEFEGAYRYGFDFNDKESWNKYIDVYFT